VKPDHELRKAVLENAAAAWSMSGWISLADLAARRKIGWPPQQEPDSFNFFDHGAQAESTLITSPALYPC